MKDNTLHDNTQSATKSLAIDEKVCFLNIRQCDTIKYQLKDPKLS